MNDDLVVVLKEIHPVINLQKFIRIGIGAQHSFLLEKNDEIEKVIENLKTPHLIKELVEKFPGIDIREFLEFLYTNGIIEEFTDIKDIPDRYLVNLNSYNSLLPPVEKLVLHDKIKNLNILLLGIGGIGTHVSYVLAELGINKVVAVDFDTIEEKNLNRQILYNSEDTGKYKADVAKKRINAFNPEIDYVALRKEITSENDVVELINDYSIDLIVNVADYPAAEIDIWVTKAVVRTNKRLISMLVDKHEGRSFVYIPNVTPCFCCLQFNELETNEHALEELEMLKEKKFRVTNAALGASCMYWGYFIGYELIKMYHTDNYMEFIKNNHLVEINFLLGTQNRSSFEANTNCMCKTKI